MSIDGFFKRRYTSTCRWIVHPEGRWQTAPSSGAVPGQSYRSWGWRWPAVPSSGISPYTSPPISQTSGADDQEAGRPLPPWLRDCFTLCKLSLNVGKKTRGKVIVVAETLNVQGNVLISSSKRLNIYNVAIVCRAHTSIGTCIFLWATESLTCTQQRINTFSRLIPLVLRLGANTIRPDPVHHCTWILSEKGLLTTTCIIT